MKLDAVLALAAHRCPVPLVAREPRGWSRGRGPKLNARGLLGAEALTIFMVTHAVGRMGAL